MNHLPEKHEFIMTRHVARGDAGYAQRFVHHLVVSYEKNNQFWYIENTFRDQNPKKISPAALFARSNHDPNWGLRNPRSVYLRRLS